MPDVYDNPSGMAGSPGRLGQVDLLLRALDTLPPLVPSVPALLELVCQGQGAVAWAPVLEADADAAAMLLVLARRKNPSASADQITLVLTGPEILFSLLTWGVSRAIPDQPPACLNRAEFWRHSLATALAAELLWNRRPLAPASRLPLAAGLLHDVGKLALCHCLPEGFARAVAEARTRQTNLAQIERQLLGVDHTLVGRRLARLWNLPAGIQEAIWLHHQPPAAMPAMLGEGSVAAMVQLADMLARRQQLGFAGNSAPVRPSELAQRAHVSAAELTELGAQLVERFDHHWEMLSADGVGQASWAVASASPLKAAAAGNNYRLAALQRQVQVLWLNRDFAAQAGTELSVPQLCGHIARTFAAACGVTATGSAPVGVVAPSGQGQVVLALWDGRTGAARFAAVKKPLPEMTGRLLSGGAFLREVLANPLEWEGLVEAEGWLCLPLVSLGKWTGVVLLPACARVDASDEGLMTLAEVMGFALAGAVCRAGADQLAEPLAQSSQQLSPTQEALAAALTWAAVGEMAAGAAHEMNNPLAVISGRAQMLAKDAQTPAQRDMANLIVRKAMEISSIASDLMEFARPATPRPQPVELAQLIEGALGRLSPEPEKLAMTLETELAADCPPVMIDPAQIGEVFTELMRNAITAGGGKADMRIEAWRSGPGKVLVKVSDDGPGMDDVTLASAFTPFFSQRPAGRGRGMGLARAKRYVQANGGRIWIESRPGAGTTINVELPAARLEGRK